MKDNEYYRRHHHEAWQRGWMRWPAERFPMPADLIGENDRAAYLIGWHARKNAEALAEKRGEAAPRRYLPPAAPRRTNEQLKLMLSDLT